MGKRPAEREQAGTRPAWTAEFLQLLPRARFAFSNSFTAISPKAPILANLCLRFQLLNYPVTKFSELASSAFIRCKADFSKWFAQRTQLPPTLKFICCVATRSSP